MSKNKYEVWKEDKQGATKIASLEKDKYRPSINDEKLKGNKTSDEIHVQDKLISGENIKTINHKSLLGSGNINIEGSGGGLVAVEHDETLTGYGTEEDPLGVDSTKFQSPLVSGTNIKTINNTSLLGSGNIDIEGGSGSGIKSLSTDDYNYPANDPTSIAGWLLDPDVYQVDGTNVLISRHPDEDHALAYDTGDIFIKLTEANANTTTIPPKYLYTQNKNNDFSYYVDKDALPEILKIKDVIDNVTTQSAYLPLSAKQGYVLKGLIDNKQDTLVSGTNIKTINNISVLGRGNIKIDGALTDDIKNALLDCFENVAWTSGDGQEYYDALEEALFPPVVVTSISATFTQGQNVIYPTDSLDSLKQYLAVTATFADESTQLLQDSDYVLSGTLSVGTSTITATYGGKSDTFNVTVSAPVELSSISATYTQTGTVYTTDTLDSLKANLVVTGNYSDSSTRTIASTDYTLLGSLTAGTSTITVSYEGKTTTFTVTVTAVVLTSIVATFNQGQNVIYEGQSLDSLKQYLTVTALYSNSTSVTLQDNEYTLSGTLATGSSTITATYSGETDTFSVIVTAVKSWLYRFNDTKTSSTSNDFGLTGVENYTTGHSGTDKAYYHEVGTVGTASTDPLGLKAINLTDNTAPNLDGDFTISFWCATQDGNRFHPFQYGKYTTGATGLPSYISTISDIKSNWNVTNNGYANWSYAGFLVWSTGDNYILVAIHDNEKTCTSQVKIYYPSGFDMTQWHHYAFTKKGNILRIFVDGEKICNITLNATSIYHANQLSIGNLFKQNAAEADQQTQHAYGEKIQDFYIAEYCKWENSFDPSTIDYGEV